MALRRSPLLVQRMKHFMSLSSSDRRLLCRAFVALSAVDLSLRTRGFQGLLDRAQSAHTAIERRLTPDEVARAYQYARWLEAASRIHIVPAHCLHRSLALHSWLLKDGLPSTLRIGVRKADGDLRAHAWVELGGHVLNDQPHDVAVFTPLANAVGESPTWARTTARVDQDQMVLVQRGALSWQ
jgi:hypothetical protein